MPLTGLSHLTRHKIPFLLLLPVLSVVGGLFVGGLVLALAQSLGYFPATGETAFSLVHYRTVCSDPEFRSAFLLTFVLAAVATMLSAVLGFAVALAVRDLRWLQPVWRTLLQIPLALPHLAMAVVVINLASSSGLLARLAFACGLVHSPAEFPSLVNDRYGAGIVLSYCLKEIPFIALMTLALLVRIGDDFDMVAQTLGASSWQRFRHVTLPLAAPAVLSASLMVFAFLFGAFEVPFLLGRTYPAMLAVVAQQKFMNADLAQRPVAIALSVVISLITSVLVWLYLRMAQRMVGGNNPESFLLL
ncbi:MAG: ABC transporter permease subunit [Blastocatellia bacterium]|nr:ABC transporter permease subunit [Blastocatellia bacterium]